MKIALYLLRFPIASLAEAAKEVIDVYLMTQDVWHVAFHICLTQMIKDVAACFYP